jgi:molybdate transport system ATP-binding protein
MSFDIDVRLRRGEAKIASVFAVEGGATVLFGPSGVGKTSVMHAVAGLVRPEAGHVRVAGRTLFDAGTDLPPEQRRAGYVFQEPRLFPHLRVRANLLYGAPAGTDPAGVAETLDIARLLDRWPRTLSGGEARRVAIARALLSDPAFLLMDEPLSSLDRARREEAMRAIERVRDETGLPMLIVTHDPEEAERLGHRIVRM